MKELVFKIVNRYIDPPKSLRTNELQAWLNGYARCQSDVLDMIDNLEDKRSKHKHESRRSKHKHESRR